MKPAGQFEKFENTITTVVTMLKVKFINHLHPLDTTPQLQAIVQARKLTFRQPHLVGLHPFFQEQLIKFMHDVALVTRK